MSELQKDSEVGDLECLERLFPGAKTIGECFRVHYERNVSKLWAKLPDGDRTVRLVMRYFQPWPAWVLRCMVEVWSVFIPTMKKELIWDCLVFVRWLLFEMRFDEDPRVEPPPFPRIDAQAVGTLAGHVIAMHEYLRVKLERALATGAISTQEHATFTADHAKELSAEGLLRQLEPHVSRYFKARPVAWLQFSEAMVSSRRKTLDDQGNLKETTATAVYSMILRHWPEVEEMSGPTELCAFLDPVLVGSDNDQDKKLDRVKKLCRRLEVRFRPFVKGQGC